MFTLPNLPYEYGALEPYLDEATMRVHHDGHHATYIKNLNEVLADHHEFLNMDVEELLKSLDRVPEEIRVKVKNNAGGHYHHSIFWPMLSAQDGGAGQATADVLQEIKRSFGDFEAFRNQFNQSALTLFGSGWTWVVWEDDRMVIVNTPNQDSPITAGQYPLLGLDVWEHAYYLKYKNKRAEYIEAYWNIVSWGEVARRLERAKAKH